jgi:hypothetical protein
MTYEQEIIEQIRLLDVEERRRVLEFARSLRYPKGISGKEFLERTKDIRFDDDMIKAIEEGFETIDDDPDVNFDD